MPAPQELLAAFQQAQRNYAAHGISTVQEGMFAAQLIPLYRRCWTTVCWNWMWWATPA